VIDDKVIIGDEQFYHTKVKPNMNNNGYQVDGVLVGVG
jgi:hypothetical protein